MGAPLASAWAFEQLDARSESSGVVPPTAAWPVPVGRLGTAAGKGPWLARLTETETETEPEPAPGTRARFVAVTAERDPDVASAAGVDALGSDACSAWRLVARAPAVLTNRTGRRPMRSLRRPHIGEKMNCISEYAATIPPAIIPDAPNSLL